MAAAERAFSADAGRLGTPAAFLAHLASDSTVFTPKPENGLAMKRAQKDDGSRLAWEPSYVEVAASGDFAVSTGAWSWRMKPGATPSLFGHFLSLWVLRQGRWQVLADIGVSQPARSTGFQVLLRRWVVGCTFAWIGRYLCSNKDHEQLYGTIESLIHLAMTRFMLARLAA